MVVTPERQGLRHRSSAFTSIRAAALQSRLRILAIGVAVLALVLGLYWHFGGNGASSQHAEAAAPVRTAKVVRQDMAIVEHTLGTVVANATVQVTARVQGTLESAEFREGQFVKRGDLLFKIDPRPFQATLAQAEADLDKDEALLKNAVRDKARYESLYAQSATSSQQRDTSATNVDVLTATVAADRAALDTAKLNLGYSEIRSPIDGKTGPILVQPGNMVSASGQTALVTIAQVRPVKLSFNLPQKEFAFIQERQKVTPLIASIDVRDPQNHLVSAPVDFISNEVNNQSGTFELRADFANSDLALLPGQLVNVSVKLNDIPNALVVPRSAVNDGPDGAYVYVVAGGHAVQRSVAILFDDTQSIAIRGNVKPGDVVIIEGQLRVIPGGEVHILPPSNMSQSVSGASPDTMGGSTVTGNVVQ